VSIAESDPASQTPLSVNGSDVQANCAIGTAQVRVSRGPAPSPPITGQWIKDGVAPETVLESPSSGASNAISDHSMGFTGTIREASGRISRITLNVFYSPGAYGGPEACFFQGTIERSGG